MSESCAGCGLAIAGGTAACNDLFMELVARASGDLRYGRLQRFMVDVYALQHPDAYCESAKSFAAHLCGLCCAMEFDAAPSVHDAILRWLNGPAPVARPSAPEARGALTIADVRAMPPETYEAALRRWAESVWVAYAPLHATAREWVNAALEAHARRR